MATGLPNCCAMPMAKKPATRSSGITMHLICLLPVNAITNGADLEPGQMTTYFIPAKWQVDTKACIWSLAVVNYKSDCSTLILDSVSAHSC